MLAAMRLAVASTSLIALVLVAGSDERARPVLAQQRAALETIQIRPNVFVIFGGGANVTAHVGEDGVLLVDSGSTATADAVLQAIKAISSQPIRLIINTSADTDHVGGNERLAKAGVRINPDAFSDQDQATVLAHENVLSRMSAPNDRAGSPPGTPARQGANESLFPVGAWPNETYTARIRSMYLNNDGVQVMRQVGAHSDGDSIVLFRRADVIATGDILDLRHFPVIDAENGGSIQGEIDALNHLLELTIPAMPLVLKDGRTLLVPGHGRLSDYGELVEYRDMVTVIRDLIEDMVDKGMTATQVKAANPAKGYRQRFGVESGPWTTDMFVDAIYSGVAGAKGKS
jgi:glyoxylase-like metal-dependent hydrolase (beta-lactamase superfamily II)